MYGSFKADVYSLSIHATVLYEMTGFLLPELATAFLDDLLQCTRAERPTAMIADPRAMKVLSKEFQTLVQQRFWPEIAALGVKKNPALVPAEAITAQSVNRMVRAVGETVDVGNGRVLEIALFSSLDECLSWIQKKQP